MPVDTKHKNYNEREGQWARCRDAAEGEDAVKGSGAKYLPMLSGQRHSEYNAYRNRACFYSATERTIQGLSGAILRKAPQIDWPENDRDRLERVGYKNEPFTRLIKAAVDDVLEVGRIGFLVDAFPDQPAYITTYPTESIVNWSTMPKEGREVVDMVVVSEEVDEVSAEDPFEVEDKVQYRVLRLGDEAAFVRNEKGEITGLQNGFRESDIEEPFYYQEVWVEDRKTDDGNRKWTFSHFTVPRTVGGRLLREIPFVFIGPTGQDPNPEKPPLLDLVNVNLSHYRNSADLEHGLHFTALPTPWAAGFKMSDGASALRVGSGTAWISEYPEAKCGMLEFRGQGLQAIETRMGDKKKDMAVLGARMLEQQKVGVEAADTVRLRQAGEHSALANIAISVSQGLTKVLRWVRQWDTTAKVDSVGLELSRDFDLLRIDAQLLVQLMASLQGGLISWDTWVHNLARGEILPDGRTAKEEAALIGEGLPEGMGVGTRQTGDEPPPDDEVEDEEGEGED